MAEPNTSRPEHTPEGNLADEAELLASEVAARLKSLRLQNGKSVTSSEVRNLLSFDVAHYDRVVELCSPQNTVRLTDSPEHMGMLQKLYEELQIRTSAFHALGEGKFDEFDDFVQKGGYVDRFKPKPAELAALQKRNPNYVSSGEELRRCLAGEHERCTYDDFYAWGHVDPQSGELQAMTAVWLPPEDEDRLTQHSAQVQKFFSGRPIGGTGRFTPDGDGDVSQLSDRASTEGEFFMIGAAPQMRGAGLHAYHAMLQQPEVQEAITSGRLTDLHLLRFEVIKLVEPSLVDNRVARENSNEGSRALFRGLGYRSLGRYRDPMQFAARELDAGNVVVVTPTWTVAHATIADTLRATGTAVSELQYKAALARSAATAS